MTTLPTIHLNGTSRQELLDDYLQALNTVRDAIKALDKIEFNARDYYVQGPNAFEHAREERQAQYSHLWAVKLELEAIAVHISDAGA
jgi:hypothetical protein